MAQRRLSGFCEINQEDGLVRAQILGSARSPHMPSSPVMIPDSRFADAWSRLPDYLGSHVLVSLTALVIGLGFSLPVAIVSRRRPLLRGALLTVASIVQTIPGLALLALFYPLLLAMAALSERVVGKSFSALGFTYRVCPSRL